MLAPIRERHLRGTLHLDDEDLDAILEPDEFEPLARESAGLDGGTIGKGQEALAPRVGRS